MPRVTRIEKSPSTISFTVDSKSSSDDAGSLSTVKQSGISKVKSDFSNAVKLIYWSYTLHTRSALLLLAMPSANCSRRGLGRDEVKLR